MLILSNFYPNQGPILCSKPHLKSENPSVPGGGGFTILKTPGTPGEGD